MSISRDLQSATGAALNLLSFRPRSEAELRGRLNNRFTTDIVNQVISTLIRQNMVNDYKFAELWRNNRLSFAPRSATRIKQELVQKGVASEIAASVIKDVDDSQTAYCAALKLAQKSHLSNPDILHRKIQSYLKRRGYTNPVIHSAIVRLHDEHYYDIEIFDDFERD